MRESDRATALAGLVIPTLAATAVMFVLAAGAEIGRYCILLYNRTRLVDPQLLAASDASVWATSFLSLLLVVFAAVTATAWLLNARADAYEREGRSEPRRRWVVAVGCLVPVANLIFPGVFLTDIARGREPRTRTLVTVWWYAWVFTFGFAVFNLLWRLRDSLQDEANGVLYAATGDLVAAAMAVLTILVIRAIDGHDVLGRRRAPKRWLIATGPAEPVIEPIRPKQAAAQQEVMAK